MKKQYRLLTDTPRSVIVATGLIALVDDCIKVRWHLKKPHRSHNNNHHHQQLHRPASSHGDDLNGGSPGSALSSGRSIMKGIFNRRHSEQHQRSPLRHGQVMAAC